MDAFQKYSEVASQKSTILYDWHLPPQNYVFMSFHRSENVDSEENCLNLLRLIKSVDVPIVFPMHPRTKKNFEKYHLLGDLKDLDVLLLPPLSYLDTLVLINNCCFVITDSGGVQREAFFAHKYNYFFFFEDIWPQIAECGYATSYLLSDKTFDFSKKCGSTVSKNPFGDGHAATNIVFLLQQIFTLA